MGKIPLIDVLYFSFLQKKIYIFRKFNPLLCSCNTGTILSFSVFRSGKSVYNGGDITKDEMQVVAQDTMKMTELMEAETKIETVLKAQGFEDVLCYLSGSSANIIVKTEGLDTAGAAKIKDALLSEVELTSDNITIVEVN